MKNKTIMVNTYGFATAGSITLLNGMAMGYDEGERIGREMFMDSIVIKGWKYPQSEAVLNLENARTMLIYDKAPNGVAPTVADVLEEVSVSSYYNWDNKDRFVVLYDRSDVLGPFLGGYTGYAVNPGVTEHEEIPLGLGTTYGGSGSLISAMISGALFMLNIGSSSAGVIGEYQFQLRYLDI